MSNKLQALRDSTYTVSGNHSQNLLLHCTPYHIENFLSQTGTGIVCKKSQVDMFETECLPLVEPASQRFRVYDTISSVSQYNVSCGSNKNVFMKIILPCSSRWKVLSSLLLWWSFFLISAGYFMHRINIYVGFLTIFTDIQQKREQIVGGPLQKRC